MRSHRAVLSVALVAAGSGAWASDLTIIVRAPGRGHLAQSSGGGCRPASSSAPAAGLAAGPAAGLPAGAPGGSRLDCGTNLSAALTAAAHPPGAGTNVTVVVGGGVYTPPSWGGGVLRLVAPATPTAAALTVVGATDANGSPLAVLDAQHTSAILVIEGGVATVRGLRFINGAVNGTDGKGLAPVLVTAQSVAFAGCAFAHHRGFDGGAILAYHNTLSFTRCVFSDNRGYGGGDGGAHDTGGGGAICIVESTLEINDCVFEDNVATDPPDRPLGTTGTHHGGAVMNIQGHVSCRGTTFIRGNAHQGGALYTWMWGLMVVDNCTFVNNTAIGASHNTGGAIFTDRGSLIVSNSTFIGNVANNSGGAIFGWSAAGSCRNLTGGFDRPALAEAGASCVPGVPCVCQNVTVSGSTFRDNVGRHPGAGGALSNQWSTFILRNNLCVDNVPSDVWVDGSTNISGGTCKGHH